MSMPTFVHVAVLPQPTVLAAAAADVAFLHFPLRVAAYHDQNCCDHTWSWLPSLQYATSHALPADQ